eukprot:6060379-Amphidinium_carterae.1
MATCRRRSAMRHRWLPIKMQCAQDLFPSQRCEMSAGRDGLEVMAVADPRVQPVTVVVAYPVDKDDS